LEYEKNRDLYEKQRVQDNFLEEHRADNDMLNSYYVNTYKKSKAEKFNYFAFVNTYDPKDLRFHYAISIGTTLLTTAGLFMVHPMLTALLLYDYYLLLGFTKVLNQTTFALVLDHGKRHIYLNRLNFLGYQREFKENRVSLRTVRYIGEYTNEFVTLDNKGLLPSISRLMNFGGVLGKKQTEVDKKKMGPNR
jgi:sRNA-binding regulator protein Hfq